LLLPLLADDLVSKIEYEQLLASPGGPGWQEDHVEDSLAERLGDCHERYIEILKEMEETMVLLCKATKVDDEQFQALLKSQNVRYFDLRSVRLPTHCISLPYTTDQLGLLLTMQKAT